MEKCQSVTFEAKYDVCQRWTVCQCIGDGNEPFIMDDLIKLPPSMAM